MDDPLNKRSKKSAAQATKRLTLPVLADAINAVCAPRFKARVERWHEDTSTKIVGTRLRRQGRGRYGLRLLVLDATGRVVLNHNNAETYRMTYEAEAKALELCGAPLARELKRRGVKAVRPWWASS